MKKNLKKIILVALIFTVITSLLMVTSFANVVTEYNSCADHYFTELVGDAIPENVFDSCGYVASAMLLAYYDAYWNDNFVSDVYEQDVTYESIDKDFGSSTFLTENGLLEAWHQQYQSEGGTLSEKDYKKQIYTGFVQTDHAWDFLQLDLIKIGISKGYHVSVGETEHYGINLHETAEVLDKYLDGVFGEYKYYDPTGLYINQNPPLKIKTLNSNLPGTQREDVISKIAELTATKTPMLYGACDDQKEYHLMVLYSTTNNNENQVVDYELNLGWANDETLSTFNSTDLNSNISILWLEIDESRIPHVCSDNYIEVIDGTTKRYCSCQVYGDLHKVHQHEYNHNTENLVSRNENTHVYNCKWGCNDPDDIIEESHAFMYDRIDDSGNHIYKCKCGQEMVGSHFFTYIQLLKKFNDAPNYHYKRCACGYEELESHTFGPSEYPQYRRCTKCGYMRNELGGGSTVIMGKKEDEEDA